MSPGAEGVPRSGGHHRCGSIPGAEGPPGTGDPPVMPEPCPCPQARNAREQGAMLERVERHNQTAAPGRRVRISVELEKPREELLPLMRRGQVVRGRGGGAGSPVLITCPGRGQRRGGAEVGTGVVRSAWGGAQRETGAVLVRECQDSGGAGVRNLNLGVQAGSGERHKGVDLIPPGWGAGDCPRPSPSSTGVHQQGPGPALRVPIGPRGPEGAAGAHPARVGGYLRGAGGHTVCPRPTSHSPRATLICAWAEEGADAIGPDGQLLHSDAFPPETLVDTLGAGDTFNAAVIFALAEGGHRHGTATTWPWFSLAWPQHGHGTATSHPGPHPQGGPCRMPSPSAAGSRAGNVGSRASMALSELAPGDLRTPPGTPHLHCTQHPPIKAHAHHSCLPCALAVPLCPGWESHCPRDVLTTAKVTGGASYFSI